jgi:hypothetical protein
LTRNMRHSSPEARCHTGAPQRLERSAENVAGEKEQRAEGLLLPHLGGAELGGVPEATETDEPLGPVDIGRFGSPTQMLEARVGLQRLQEGRRERTSVKRER